MDDLRLDESFSYLFRFNKGDVVTRKDDPSFRGTIRDGVYIGQFPAPTAGSVNSRGKTLYEIILKDDLTYIVDETDIEKATT